MRSGAIIYPILKAYASLTDLVSYTKFFAVRAKQATRSPYLVYREISTVPLNTKGDSQDVSSDPRIRQRSILDVSRVQISVFADDYVEVENIAVEVREALDREWGSVPSPYENDIFVDSIVFESSVDDYDDTADDRGIYVKHLDFIIRVNRLFISTTWINTYSLAFDGVDDYVTFGDNALWSINGSGGNRGFSFSLWVKLTESESAQYIINKSGFWDSGSNHYEYFLVNRYNNTLRFQMYFGDTITNYIQFTTEEALEDDTWYHIVVTYDLSAAATGLNMYINNVVFNTTKGTATVALTGSWGTPADTVAPVYMGRGSAEYSDCKIDEFGIWDDVLTVDDVDDLYNAGATGDPNIFPLASDYLVGFWRNGDGATFPNIPDIAPNYSNQGVMTNMAAEDINTDVPT